MNATIRGEAHEVEALAILFGVAISSYDFLILHDAVIGTCAVDLHEVLVYHTAGTDVEVTYLRVTHLSVGQTYVLTAGLQLRVRIGAHQIVPVGSGSVEDNVTLTLASTPFFLDALGFCHGDLK